MGVAFIVLGLLAAGLVVDFLAENDLSALAGRTYSIFGGSFHLSEPQLVIGSAMLGALAVVLVFLGFRMLRGSRGRRRAMRHRVVELERENTALRSRAHLVDAVSVTDVDSNGSQEARLPAKEERAPAEQPASAR